MKSDTPAWPAVAAQLDRDAIPRHVAIIMDGNGRWAKQRGLPRTAGHEVGAQSVRAVVELCGQIGVEVLTLYSFSTENWSRPEDEVSALMGLLERYLREEMASLIAQEVRLRSIGDIDALPEDVRELLRAGEAATAQNTGLQLVLALSYGARREITSAVQAIAHEVALGVVRPDQVTESLISAHLYTKGLPDPDLLIRTSGDQRLSNFLLWQIAYTELYITPVMWPEFREAALVEALDAYSHRQRRFGLTGEQVRTP